MHETIGRCDLCGLVDHHLRQGLCPTCREKHPDRPPVERMLTAAAALIPVAQAAAETGLLTARMERKVRRAIDEWKAALSDVEEALGYEAAWPEVRR